MAKKEIEDHRPEVVKFFFKELLPVFDKNKDLIVMPKKAYETIEMFDDENVLTKIEARLMVWESALHNLTIVRAGYGVGTNIPFFVMS